LKPRLFTPPEELVRPQLIGINRASTFTGFCQRHDAELFRPLELNAFAGTAEQVTLLAYRILCRELYAKRAALGFVPTIRQGDRGGSDVFQAWVQSTANVHELGTRLGLRDAELEKARYDAAVRAGDYTAIGFLVVTFAEPADFVFSSGYFPDASFAGERLQSLANLERSADAMTVSLVTTDTGSAAVLAWLAPSAASERFALSLDALADEAIPHALVRFAFETESVFSSPVWWENLTSGQRDALVTRTAHSANPTLPALPDRYLDDGLRVVRWTVNSRIRSF
jgi:hypothetical protein